MRYKITALTALLLFMLGAVAVPDKASSASPSTRSISTGPCTSHGYTAGFVHDGDDLLALPFEHANTIHELVCRTRDGMRIMRLEADTFAERYELRRMAALDAKSRFPIAVCGTGGGRAYAIDLAFYYFDSIKKMKPVEVKTYKTWVTDYAAAPSDGARCTLFGVTTHKIGALPS